MQRYHFSDPIYTNTIVGEIDRYQSDTKTYVALLQGRPSHQQTIFINLLYFYII